MQNKLKGKILTAQEVQSILNGSKVMFREVIKPQPEEKIKGYFYSPNQTTGYCESLFVLDKCPYKVGEEIFVKEKWFCVGKWRPAKSMPIEHSRLTLQIKSIKVERLQDISYKDCLREGIEKVHGRYHRSTFPETYDYVFKDYTSGDCITYDPRKSFRSLWNETHKKPEEKWEASPWVWCVSFEVVR